MKYDSEAQEVLDYLAGDQSWNSGSSGDVEAPTGYFSALSLPEYADAREGYINYLTSIGEPVMAFPNANGTVSNMVGHWLIIHDDQGFVYFSKFDTEEELAIAFTENDEAYSEWVEGFEDF